MQVVGLPTGILFLGSASGKDSTCRHRRCKRHAFDPWVGKIPGGGNGNPLQYFLPGKFHGQRSLAGYSPGSCKDLDPIERQSTYYFKSSLKYVDTFVQ